MSQRYKAQVVSLEAMSEGIQRAYNVSEKELQRMMQEHRCKVNGSNGNYVIYDGAKSRLYLYLYIRENLKTVKIDIRPKVIAFSGKKVISKSFRLKLKAALPKTVEIELNEDRKWVLSNPDILMKAVREALNQ